MWLNLTTLKYLSISKTSSLLVSTLKLIARSTSKIESASLSQLLSLVGFLMVVHKKWTMDRSNFRIKTKILGTNKKFHVRRLLATISLLGMFKVLKLSWKTQKSILCRAKECLTLSQHSQQTLPTFTSRRPRDRSHHTYFSVKR